MVGIRIPAEAWEGVEEGTEALLERWLVREGDVVTAGQPVATAILVKTNYEIAAPAAGRIAKTCQVCSESPFACGTKRQHNRLRLCRLEPDYKTPNSVSFVSGTTPSFQPRTR